MSNSAQPRPRYIRVGSIREVLVRIPGPLFGNRHLRVHNMVNAPPPSASFKEYEYWIPDTTLCVHTDTRTPWAGADFQVPRKSPRRLIGPSTNRQPTNRPGSGAYTLLIFQPHHCVSRHLPSRSPSRARFAPSPRPPIGRLFLDEGICRWGDPPHPLNMQVCSVAGV